MIKTRLIIGSFYFYDFLIEILEKFISISFSYIFLIQLLHTFFSAPSGLIFRITENIFLLTFIGKEVFALFREKSIPVIAF